VSPAPPNSEAVTGAIEGFSQDGWPVIHGQAIRIFGIASLPVAGRRFRRWLAANVIALTCEPRPSNTYRCLTQNRVDLAQAVLINGGSSTSSDGPQEYLDYQQQARDAKRGIWGSALTHPIRDAARF
jgi:hypothetical protein